MHAHYQRSRVESLRRYRDLKLHKPEANKYEIRQRSVTASSAAGARDDTGDDIGQIVSTDQISLYVSYQRSVKDNVIVNLPSKRACRTFENALFSLGKKRMFHCCCGFSDSVSLSCSYYTKLSEKMKELDLSKRPYDIYMLEETQCEIFTNLNEKEIVTVLACASCTGDVKPPMLTFKVRPVAAQSDIQLTSVLVKRFLCNSNGSHREQ